MPVSVGDIQSAYDGLFAEKDPGEIEFCLSFASRMCPPQRWGTDTDRGIQLLTSHLLMQEWYEEARLASAAVPIAGGNASASPNGGGDWQSQLSETVYGRQFLWLRRQVIGVSGRVIGDSFA